MFGLCNIIWKEYVVQKKEMKRKRREKNQINNIVDWIFLVNEIGYQF